MATFLPQFQSIKTAFDHVVLAVEDVSDLWPTVKKEFQERLPFKRVFLNNKTHNSVLVNELPAEYILTTDSRLRSRFPQEQSLFWFREPYATIVLVTCEDLDEFKNILKPRLKHIVQNDEKEWFIVFVSKAPAHSDQATKMAKKVYAKLEVDFNTKKRERCCKFDLYGPESHFWEDLEGKIMECIRNTLDRRIQFYEEEIRKLSEQRFMPIWNFCNFFILKESLAFMFEIAHLHEDALREYDELELCYLETVNMIGRQRDFGGLERGDDQAMLLDTGRKALTQIVQDDSFREFEFRQYLFACQAKLLFKLNRPYEVASRGYSFIISFSKALAQHESILPFCMREIWVITACSALASASASHYEDGLAPLDVEKEFFRVQGELYALCRTKFMRLGYLIGYGSDIERSPVNSASLSMLPWPKPAVWPSLPPDASSEVLAKEKMILQESPRPKHFGIQRKPLPLEPSVLLREANRRRASLSAGNMFELIEGRPNSNDSSGPQSSMPKASTLSMSRTFSSPGNFEGSIDRPMRLAEIYVAAEHALKASVSDATLWNSLSSVEEFEKRYLDLSKGAANNYHRSWWKRHGVVLDGEIASVYHKHENYDVAANLYEKVCALYAGEGWEHLLAEVLPNLAECQKILSDQAGYLSSCVRLLSLDKSLFLTKERQAFQSEVVRLAHSEMEHPVPLDVSSLITFSGSQGPPLELCDGDPGTLSVTLWSGFPDDITLESLSVTLTATNNTDEGAKAIKRSEPVVLSPGRNNIALSLPPQKPGSYVLGVLTGQIGQLRFRSHSFSKGGPADTDDFMSYEKPTRPILKVAEPRPLVDLAAAVSSGLLMNESQWVGVIVRPIDYSLKGAVLHVDTGPGLSIESTHGIEIEKHEVEPQSKASFDNQPNDGSALGDEIKQLSLEDSKIKLPDWTSNITSVLWIPLRAASDGLPKGTPAGTAVSQRQNIVDGLRTIALKLDFGVSHNQTFEKTIAVHFTDPLHVSTSLADKCSDGNLLLQVILQSQVKASLVIHDAWLDLQDGLSHAGKGDGRPASNFFPLTVSPKSRAGILFSICLSEVPTTGEASELHPDNILHIRYSISGSRKLGAHGPIAEELTASNDNKTACLTFRSVLALKRPVLDPFLAVGFLSLPSTGLRVGQFVTMKWRVERLKDSEENEPSDYLDEVLYEIKVNSENWMIAGRKRGYVSLSKKQGSRIVISILCLPLVAGYVRPPQLGLPNVGDANISCNPPGPHLVCIMPPTLSSSYCIPAT
ncbi:trafficking protein particle complex II-specific subunit 130 homolog [Andrographis paniculata]|uniref:trafficking protein particle complex II-specific subunit 130 homolog n=1 Tax=Andrographis paniculata TaxID=175694 RepID=UPI0021E92A1F|nr:trafficking protein particle complex II-specific subunit 130 homolog [Andrographis paniculata]XP_051133823.1 trafficking protein particle complex II-specific subunit 130 homolog [Andrographis paniculata]XP_051133824.1 trafficking protein particle complex II-specific subunit 130 homolog [Andrographis paniculata]